MILALFTSCCGWTFLFVPKCKFYSCLIVPTKAAVAVIIGWNTKYTMPILWFAHYSVLGRVQDLLHGADPWMRILLFNAMFLPLDRAWAITPSKNSVNQGMKVVSIATFIHWANIMALYVRNWSVKLGGIAWVRLQCWVLTDVLIIDNRMKSTPLYSSRSER